MAIARLNCRSGRATCVVNRNGNTDYAIGEEEECAPLGAIEGVPKDLGDGER